MLSFCVTRFTVKVQVYRSSTSLLLNDLRSGRKAFNALPTASIDATHIVAEQIKYIHRPDTANRLAQLFAMRQYVRNKSTSPMDKTHNDVIALPGIPGCGKSSFLANFPKSLEYNSYINKTGNPLKPLIALVTFNSAMGIDTYGVAPGLRVLYGALRTSCGWQSDWSTFAKRHEAQRNMSMLTATEILRSVFGEQRPILLCVDEISKIDLQPPGERLTSELVLSDLGQILNKDGSVDIVVSALTPSYINKLLTGSQRSISYVPITPLRANDLHTAFVASGERLVRAVQAKRSAHDRKPLDPFVYNIIRNIYLLASGHPRTIEKLQDQIQYERGSWNIILKLCSSPVPPTPYQLLREVCRRGVFTHYFQLPVSEAERERILSLRPRDVTNDEVSRAMLEGTRCTIHNEQDGELLLTTSVASFFRILDDLLQKDPTQLGPLSRAVTILFSSQSSSSAFTIAQLWERAHCLSMVAHAHDALTHGGAVLEMSSIFGLQTNSSFGNNVAATLGGQLSVVLTKQGEAMPWQQDVLYVAPHCHAGSDLMLCLLGADGLGEISLYTEVKVTKNAVDLHKTVGNKLLLTLLDHVQRAGLEDKSVAEQLAALGGVYFVLSIYGNELQDDMSVLKKQVVVYTEGLAKPSKVKDLVLNFIAAHWDTHVAVQGTSDIEASMLPVTLPFAQLVQAVEPDGE